MTSTTENINQHSRTRHANSRWVVEKSVFLNTALVTAIFVSLVLTLWLGKIAVLVFLLSGFAYIVHRPNMALNGWRANWPLFLYPAWGLISVFWADAPNAAMAKAIQLFLTYAICIAALHSTSYRTILAIHAVVFIFALSSIFLSSNTVSIYATGEVIRVGVFGSKNNLSLYSAEGFVISLMLMAVAKPWTKHWLLGAFLFTVGCLVVLEAKSLGTTMAIFGCLGAAYGLYIFPSLLRNRGYRNVVLISITCVILITIFSVALFVTFEQYQSFMYALGKDPTITGRTFLWAFGAQSISEHFWGGVGLASYWKLDNPNALLMWEVAQKQAGAPFGFHNTYINTWVELGLIGMLIVTFIITTLLYRVFILTFAGLTRLQTASAMFVLFFLAKSFFEVMGFGTFSMHTSIVVLVWIILNKTHARDLR
jgi:exopolysaccharide production protein ExoQ